jgi:MFS family permease
VVAGVVQGYDMSLMGATLLAVQKEFQLTPEQVGLLMASPLGIGFLVPIFVGLLSDRIGRKYTLALSFPVASVCLTCQAFSTNIRTYALGRIGATMAIDAAATITVLYISEVAPAGRRGALTCIGDVLLRVGYVLAWTAMFILGEAPGSWRTACILGAVTPLLGACLMLLPCVPESPRYMQRIGRHAEAERILASTGGDQDEVRGTLASWDEIDNTPKQSFHVTIQTRQMLVVLGVRMFQALTGHMAVARYLLPIFTKRTSLDSAHRWAVFVSVFKLLASLPSIWLLDSWGRRPLLLLGAFFMVPSCVAIAVALATNVPEVTLLFGVAAYFAFNSVSHGTAGMVYSTELVPLEAPGFAVGLSSSLNMLVNFACLLFLPIAMESSSSAIFVVLAVTNLLGFAFYYTFCRETRGMVLEHCRDTLATVA